MADPRLWKVQGLMQQLRTWSEKAMLSLRRPKSAQSLKDRSAQGCRLTSSTATELTLHSTHFEL